MATHAKRYCVCHLRSADRSAPVVGALVIALWFGAYALVFGVILVALGFRLRNWAKPCLLEEGSQPRRINRTRLTDP